MQSHLLVGPISGTATFSHVAAAPGLRNRHGEPPMKMQSHLLVGPIPTKTATFSPIAAVPGRRRLPQLAAVSGIEQQDHYAVLGLSSEATSADIKRAFRLLARKHHPDVSNESRAAEQFKSIHQAYQVLSNETSRMQYDWILKIQQPFGQWSGGEERAPSTDVLQSTLISLLLLRMVGSLFSLAIQDASTRCKFCDEFENVLRIYMWKNLNRETESESSRQQHGKEEENASEGRVRFSEALQSTLVSLLLLRMFGSPVSLSFSTLTALLDRKLDAGYKFGYLVALILGGRPGIMLTLFLRFATWAWGKTSSGSVAALMIALWVGSNLARYTLLPQGVLLALVYTSVKLKPA